MVIEKSCDHFIYQTDDNGDFAIGYCNMMRQKDKDHEGNYSLYECPCKSKKINGKCYKIEDRK